MKKSLNIIIPNEKHKEPILTDIFYNENGQKKPIVIFCHGYKGYKDWGAWNLAAEEFAKNELFFLKFNFSHNGGTIENPIDFPNLEAFGMNNFTIELDDLETVIYWLMHNDSFKNEIDCDNITLIGHSRGGGIVSLKAAENEKISKVISWNGVSDFGNRFPKGEALAMWKKAGVSYIENARTKQKMPHYIQFYNNFKENEDRLTIRNAVSRFAIPHLIIQGMEDDVVSPEEAKDLHKWNGNSELIFIEGMNHPLGCIQPWTENKMPSHLEKTVAKSIQFIKNN